MVNMKMIFFFRELAHQKEWIYIPCPCIAISHTRVNFIQNVGDLQWQKGGLLLLNLLGSLG
jgi:hypothetical protein